MKKFTVLVGAVIAIICFSFIFYRFHTKSFSPQDQVLYDQKSTTLKVNYSRPSVKGRTVFGQLVPYGKVWRTGANEATQFSTSKDLMIDNRLLKAGKYSLFTIPDKESWKIIFNKETDQWGIDILTQEANRDESKDALVVEVSSISTKAFFEQFTIQFHEMGNDIEMVFMWENTLVDLPMIPQ
ncbi:DUF2911 domain-containing protein [Fulvivirga ligni]|uniref:DUF2911 domain-containing protein n=1 Tax=Fulvivirga ligni TaxID=2904246 RepID=UPI001F1F11BD|nr:DUF2911 domain-containing protein [Fulvivirga ligni]UII22547.1 DUF2911 domain-containing protein [Fulvivirga ligni]